MMGKIRLTATQLNIWGKAGRIDLLKHGNNSWTLTFSIQTGGQSVEEAVETLHSLLKGTLKEENDG
jgi:hypothetical protein